MTWFFERPPDFSQGGSVTGEGGSLVRMSEVPLGRYFWRKNVPVRYHLGISGVEAVRRSTPVPDPPEPGEVVLLDPHLRADCQPDQALASGCEHCWAIPPADFAERWFRWTGGRVD